MNPRTAIVEVAAVLLAARTVVTDPARWCAYPHALDANGHRCEGRANKRRLLGCPRRPRPRGRRRQMPRTASSSKRADR